MHRQTREIHWDPTAARREIREKNGLLKNAQPRQEHHDRSDYILVRKLSRPEVNINRTRSFPEADIGGDHDLLMMSFEFVRGRPEIQHSQEWGWSWTVKKPEFGRHVRSSNRWETAHISVWGKITRNILHEHHLQYNTDCHIQCETWDRISEAKGRGSLEMLSASMMRKGFGDTEVAKEYKNGLQEVSKSPHH